MLLFVPNTVPPIHPTDATLFLRGWDSIQQDCTIHTDLLPYRTIPRRRVPLELGCLLERVLGLVWQVSTYPGARPEHPQCARKAFDLQIRFSPLAKSLQNYTPQKATHRALRKWSDNPHLQAALLHERNS